MYKTQTGIIAKRISTHLEEQNLLPAEQEEYHPGRKGCKDPLIISKQYTRTERGGTRI
jgi:hypothetical protein